MVIAQRPYLPLGTLAQVLAYPLDADRFDAAAMGHALEQAELDALVKSLLQSEAWSRRLSPGEQQRLQFARLFLHRPNWILLDEATSALDAPMQALLLRRLRALLPSAGVLQVGHRTELAALHDRVLRVEDGVVLAASMVAADPLLRLA
jgi:putative ATP-binding cassette transporter